MTGLIRKATLLTFCGLFVAGAAMAGVPSSMYLDQHCGFFSSSPEVGLPCPPIHSRAGIWPGPYGSATGPGARVTAGGIPDQYFEFYITVLDAVTNPVPNVPVSINFSACRQFYLGAGNATDQPFIYTQAGGLVTCTGHIVQVNSNASGVATFRIVAGSKDVGPHPGPGLPVGGPGAGGPNEPTLGCGIVKASNSTIGRLRVTTPDLDNSSSGGGVSGQDGAIAQDIIAYCNQPGGPYYVERADISQDGVIDGNDSSREQDLVAVMNSPGHAGNNGATCSDAGHTCCAGDPLP